MLKSNHSIQPLKLVLEHAQLFETHYFCRNAIQYYNIKASPKKRDVMLAKGRKMKREGDLKSLEKCLRNGHDVLI